MEPGPPKALETIIGFLIPPACREEVLGDLHERYRSTGLYIADALSAVPLVIASRIRRTADGQMLLMEAFVWYFSLLAATWRLMGPDFLYEQRGFLRLAIPAAVALFSLILSDAYAAPGNRPRLMSLLDAMFSVAFAFLSQAAVSAGRRELVVPLWIMIWGSGMSLLLLCTLRVMFSSGGDRPRGPA